MKYKLELSAPAELDLGQNPVRFTLDVELVPVSEPPPPPASGKTYALRKSDTPARFQSVLDALRPGDTLLIDNDVELAGRFVLREQPRGGDPIIIRAAQAPSGRPTLDDQLPTLVNTAPMQGSILATDPRAHVYMLIGLRLAAKAGFVYNLLELGSGKATDVLAQPDNLLVSRCMISGHPQAGSRRGIFLNSARTTISECWITTIMDSSDAQAIAGVNGPGPYFITGNVLEASTENIMFGGSPAAIQGLNPSNITISGNAIRKPLEWRSLGKWSFKNLIELKRAENVLIENNVLENSWLGQQHGEAFVFTVRAEGSGNTPANPWAAVRNVVVRRNHISGVGAGANILGRDYSKQFAGIAENITFEHNLFLIDPRRGGRFGFQLLTGARHITIRRNTVVFEPKHQYMHALSLDGPPTNTSPSAAGWKADFPIEGLVMEKNILMGDLFGRGLVAGQPPLDKFAPNAQVRDNLPLTGGIPNSRKVTLDEVLNPDYTVKPAYAGYGAVLAP
jgi:hypothetical protein